MQNLTREQMITALGNATMFDQTLHIQMDVGCDWNKYDVSVKPEYVTDGDDYILIHTGIGNFYVDTMDVEYEPDDGCWVCDGTRSSTYIWIC